MTSLFEKIKRYLGFYPKANLTSFYKTEEKTGEPIKVAYTSEPAAELPTSKTEAQESLSLRNDVPDLEAMTKSELIAFATRRGIALSGGNRMKKQEIINRINSALELQ